MGMSAMEKLRKSSVLISGMGGVGVEIAKNLILGGVKRITIHDTKVAKWNDLSSQFYIKETDLGKNRAVACLSRLAQLNDNVIVDVLTNELSEQDIKGRNVN
jgi:ubiquitin-activating enzyme E1